MYAEYSVYMECKVKLIEVCQNEKSCRLRYALAQTILQINSSNHNITRHKNSFNAGMRIRNRRNCLICNNLSDLSDIDTV